MKGGVSGDVDVEVLAVAASGKRSQVKQVTCHARD